MVDTNDEWIVSRTGIRERRRRRGARDDGLHGRRRRAAGHPRRRHRPGRDRPDPPRDAHARLLDALDRGPRQGGDRQHPRRGDGRRRGLLRVRLRVRDRPGLDRGGPREARPRHRRGAAHALPRLHRPLHLHPLRRRRRRGRAVSERRARRRAGRRADDRAAGRLHDLAARRRREEPALGRDDRARRALHPDGGQGDLPLRDQDDGVDRARSPSASRPASPTTSTCSSRTRPTSGSSRPSRRASGLPMDQMFINLDRYGNTSAASVPIALAEAVDEGRVKVGDHDHDRGVRGRLHVRRRDDRVDGRSGARPVADAAIRPEDVHVRLPVDWDSVDPIPPALAAILAAPGPVDVPLDDVVPGEPRAARRTRSRAGRAQRDRSAAASRPSSPADRAASAARSRCASRRRAPTSRSATAATRRRRRRPRRPIEALGRRGARPPGGRHRPRGRRGADQGGPRGLRQGRHPRQQRRHHPRRPDHAHDASTPGGRSSRRTCSARSTRSRP